MLFRLILNKFLTIYLKSIIEYFDIIKYVYQLQNVLNISVNIITVYIINNNKLKIALWIQKNLLTIFIVIIKYK